jgi:excisionase family DNA binding protein
MTNFQYSKTPSQSYSSRKSIPYKPGSDTLPVEDRLMKVGEVAYVLGISIRSVWRLIASGEFPNRVKMRRCVRLPGTDVRAYVERSKQS